MSEESDDWLPNIFTKKKRAPPSTTKGIVYEPGEEEWLPPQKSKQNKPPDSNKPNEFRTAVSGFFGKVNSLFSDGAAAVEGAANTKLNHREKLSKLKEFKENLTSRATTTGRAGVGMVVENVKSLRQPSIASDLRRKREHMPHLAQTMAAGPYSDAEAYVAAKKDSSVQKSAGNEALENKKTAKLPSEKLTKTKNVRLLIDNAFTMAETARMYEEKRNYKLAHDFYVGCAGGFLQAVPLVKDERSNLLIRTQLCKLMEAAERVKDCAEKWKDRTDDDETKDVSPSSDTALASENKGNKISATPEKNKKKRLRRVTRIVSMGTRTREREISKPPAPAIPRGGPGSPSQRVKKKQVKEIALSRRKSSEDANTLSGKRDRVALEIFATEKTYVKHMKTLMRVFVTPLRQMAVDSDNVVTAEDVELWMGGLEHITTLNEKLLTDIQAKLFSWSPKATLGDVFILFAPYFKMYKRFVSKFMKASTALGKAKRENRALQKFFMEASKDSSLVESSQSLQSLMIMPVQRIPRYKMLLEELLERTEKECPKDHPDIPLLRQAVELVAEAADSVNEAVREAENAMQVLEIQESLTPEPDPGLLIPSRKFIREGAMIKISSGNGWFSAGRKIDTYFFLFNDSIVYADDNDTGPPYKFRRHLKLVDCLEIDCAKSLKKLDEELAGAEPEYCFRFITDRKSFVVICDSVEERDSWFEDVCECCETLRKERQLNTKKKGLKHHSASDGAQLPETQSMAVMAKRHPRASIAESKAQSSFQLLQRKRNKGGKKSPPPLPPRS